MPYLKKGSGPFSILVTEILNLRNCSQKLWSWAETYWGNANGKPTRAERHKQPAVGNQAGCLCLCRIRRLDHMPSCASMSSMAFWEKPFASGPLSSEETLRF